MRRPSRRRLNLQATPPGDLRDLDGQNSVRRVVTVRIDARHQSRFSYPEVGGLRTTCPALGIPRETLFQVFAPVLTS